LSEKSLKQLPPDALILAQNTPKCVWRPGSARTRWGSLSAPPDSLAAKGGLLLRGGGGEGREGGDGREGKGREKGEKRGGDGFCRTNQNMAATALHHVLDMSLMMRLQLWASAGRKRESILLKFGIQQQIRTTMTVT